MKSNIPECVLLSPEEYIRLLDEANDAQLLTATIEQKFCFYPDILITQEQVDQELGFSPSDCENTDDIFFE